MRIALLYPPPWKISPVGQPPAPGWEGPPEGFAPGDLDGDFYQVPYGLLSLASQAMHAGHEVKVLNLSAYPWPEVEHAVSRLQADLYGLSCWTANRRGMALMAEALRAHHPRAHIVVGGPHATALAPELLAHHPAIDTVLVGESEVTFLELLDRLAAKRSTRGLPGTVYRDGRQVKRGPARKALRKLDELACPHEHFTSHILMTSRGCPWSCTFCGAESSWGRGFRAHSVPYVLDALERAIARLPVKMIAIKDDTFTTDRKRVLALCRGIRERGLRFLWSCDTRVDMLDVELVRAMRLAGCQRLSLGVETGAPAILKTIDKRITIERDYDPSIPELVGDMDQLIQAMLNIVRNASRVLGEEGTVTLQTRIQRQLTIGNARYRLAAQINIIDDGPGIPPEIADTLFFPMVTAGTGGMGLGLSIAQSLINQHKGLIECTSRKGKTIFTIFLPLGDDISAVRDKESNSSD